MTIWYASGHTIVGRVGVVKRQITPLVGRARQLPTTAWPAASLVARFIVEIRMCGFGATP
jgi:hypothetical protein